MARGIHVITVLLACASVISADFAIFPHGKTTQYRYHTVVSTTTTKDAVHSSQFAIQGILDVTHDIRYPKFPNAYNFVLSNITTDMHNGDTLDYDEKPVVHGIDNPARIIEEPFLIIYDKTGLVDAMRIALNEPEWSINMKMAMASMLQLDLANLRLDTKQNLVPRFSSKEKTIYGDCTFIYNEHDYTDPSIHETFTFNKTFVPMECSDFSIHDFKNIDIEQCLDNKHQRTYTEGFREFEIEIQGKGVLIKKLVAFSSVEVLSSNGGSYPHVGTTRTTFELLDNDKQEKKSRLGNFAKVPMIRDLVYIKPQRSQAPNAAADITQGRHIVDQGSLPSRLEKLLSEAFDYMNGSHLNRKEMDWERARTINKILHTMSSMKVDALQLTYDKIKKGPELIRNIFLGVVPQVGTLASSIFTRNIILKNQIPPVTSVQMLSKFPLSVKVPTIELLAQMEDIAKLDNSVSAEVRKSGILSFASLIYRTFKYVTHPEKNEVFKKYLHEFLDFVKNEPTYEMKIVYLMAIKNIQVGKIHVLLEPIISGSLEISEDPERIRLLAIWSLTKAAEEDYSGVFHILFPVMTNNSLPTKLRIAAYEILMNQATDEKSALKIHQHVMNQDNKHFYNYHYTNLDDIARSYDQCKSTILKIARSILSTIEYPSKSDEKIKYQLSGKYSVGSIADSIFEAEKFDLEVVVNEFTGVPEVVGFKYIVADYDGTVTDFAFKVHIEGLPELKDLSRRINYWAGSRSEKLREFLAKTAKSLPPNKILNIDIILMRKGHVVISNNYNLRNIGRLYEDILYQQLSKQSDIGYQSVVFNRLYETQLISDIGVPMLVETRIPHVVSMEMNREILDSQSLELNLSIEFKSWKYGDFSMSVYNPMKDVWHSVRSITADEVNLPFRTTIAFDKENNSINLSFPESPEIFSPTAGIIVRGRHFVTVDEEGTQALAESCETCRHMELVSRGTWQINSTKCKELAVKLEGTGLKFYRCADECEYGYMTGNYNGLDSGFDDEFTSNIPKSFADMMVQILMDIRMGFKSIRSSMETRSCGAIINISPDPDNLISHLNIDWHFDYEDLDINETNLELLHAENYKVGLLIDTISSATKSTSGSWNFDAEIDTDRDHLSNRVAFKITRKTPNYKDLKICLNAETNYPASPTDYLKIEKSEEINSKFRFAYDVSDKEDCDGEKNALEVTIKAQLSDEQNSHLIHDLDKSACSEDKKNRVFASPNNFVPRTANCLEEAIRYTTPRKYVYDVTHKKLSPEFAELIYHCYTDNIEPTATGNFKIKTIFPVDADSIEVEWMTNTSDFTKQNILMKNIAGPGKGLDLNDLWDFPLDNSRFNLLYLNNYVNDEIRICSIYPKMIETGDGERKPFSISSQSWTLISGDHFDKEFAIFAKQTRTNYLSILALIGDNKVHFYTRESDDILVATATGIESATDKGFRLPDDKDSNWDVIVTKRNDHFVVRSRRMQLTLEIGPNYAFILFNGQLQGHVTGLCGQLNGNSHDNDPNIFLIDEIEGY